jgi:NAD(P)H-flavin reductase
MAAHTDTCYTVRYGRLSTDAREYWPPAFGGREDLCSCGANPDARMVKREYAEDRAEFEDELEALERHPGSRW